MAEERNFYELLGCVARDADPKNNQADFSKAGKKAP